LVSGDEVETGSSEVPGRAGALTLDRLSAIVESLYEAALQTSAWPACLEGLRQDFAGNFVSLIVRAGTRDDLGLIVSASGDHHIVDPTNPLIEMSPFTGLPPDKLVTLADILSETDWRASQYYRDWCAPRGVFHVMAVDIATQDGGIYGLRITRPEDAPAFSEADRDLYRRLHPHLKRALNLHLSINQNRRVNSLYSHAMAQLMVGVIVLDEQGLVLECNAMAQGIVEQADGLRVVGKQLEATYANDNRKLQRLVRDAMAPKATGQVALIEAMSVSRPSGRVSWGVVVQAMAPDRWTEGKHRPSVAVFVRDAEGKAHPPLKLAQQLFQLTPAETALAIELANGLSLEEAAEALGIRRNTARAHLRSIFSKTGVRRQTELVRIFLNSVAWLGTPD
jgi:DNA-binding CsgD family transcriptional regulator/PAS domain-containing protein